MNRHLPSVARWMLAVVALLAVLAVAPRDGRPASARSAPDADSAGAASSGVDSLSMPDDAPPDTLLGSHVEIHYNDCAVHATTDCISATRAQLLADQMDDAWDAYVTYGFRAPDPGDGPPLPVWAMSPLDDGAWGWARGSHVEIDIGRIQATAASVRMGSPHHELFHKVQHAYPGDEADWVDEGTCKFIEDNVFNDTDADLASAYLSRVDDYLDSPNSTLLDLSYAAALWWKYLTEQFGSTGDAYFGAEPQYGIDFLVDFWDAALGHDGVDALNVALPAGVDFEDVFHDFLIANYVKRFNVGAHYRYADDPGPAFTYSNVAVKYGVEALPVTHNHETVQDWGANYYVGDPPANCPFIQVALDGDPGDRAFYAVLATRGSDAFYYDHLGFRTVSENFAKTLYNDNYDRVVVVVGGDSDPAEYDIAIECLDPVLNIVEPRQDLFAVVGDPASPRRMDVLLEVTGAGGSFLEGVTWDEFEVSVGGVPVDAIITGAPIQGQYWLIVQPPTQDVTGDPPWKFDLDVSLAGLTDHEDDAVYYEPLPNFDEVLVIDSSDSMNSPTEYPKIVAARNAAKLYIDELGEGDMMGAAHFSTAAAPVWQGMAAVNDLARGLAKILIDGVDATGYTSLGGGLLEGLGAFDDPSYPGVAENPDSIVLLSDGMENVSPCWENHAPWPGIPAPYHDCSTGPYVRDDVVASGVPVNTVALGTGSHEALMERIAEDTGGTYRFATLPAGLSERTVTGLPALPGLEPPSGVSRAPDQGFEWAYRLAGIYDYYEGQVEGRERIRLQEVTIPDDYGGYYESSFYLDETVSQATFSIAYDTWSRLNGRCTTVRHVQLSAPNGATRTPTYSDDYHDVFEVSSPLPGTWVVRVEMFDELCAGTEAAEAPRAWAPYHYQVIASAQTGLAAKVRIGTPHEERFVGLCVPIYAAFLHASEVVQNGQLTALVTTPTGGEISLAMADDGQHGDGAAGDGIYGASFCRDTAGGSYDVVIQGRIEAMAGTIWRQAEASFYVQPDDDTEGDGLPNHWELVHGLDPGTADDSGNPDLDFLCFIGCGMWTNTSEYAYGTDPNDDDSDGGGEMDASELLNGTDPNGAGDDGVAIPTSFSVTPGNGQNVIHHDVRPVDSSYWLFWSTDPQMGDMLDHLVDLGMTGVYSHTGLTNGLTYYYRLVAIRGAHVSGFADQEAGTPAVDAVPPSGEVQIDGGAERAASLNVTLNLSASDDTVEMLIANKSDFAGATWEAFSATRAWRIVPRPEGTAFVYVRYRDAAGNVSGTAADGILLPLTQYLPIVLKGS